MWIVDFKCSFNILSKSDDLLFFNSFDAARISFSVICPFISSLLDIFSCVLE